MSAVGSSATMPGQSASGLSGKTASPCGPAGEWERAMTALGSVDEVCLACHVHPDGDALGSMLAMAQALHSRQAMSWRESPGNGGHGERRRERPQRVVVSFGDELLHVPDNLRFLPGLDLLTAPRDYPAAPQLMIALDTASRGRLGTLAPNAARAGELIVIDHHPTNTRYGTIHLVDPAAAATAVLVCQLIDRLGVPLTRDVALGLYAGLVTDTGSFKYASTTAAVHSLAARLLATGIQPAVVAGELFDRATFGYLRVLSAALERAVLEPAQAVGRGLVWTTVSRADRRPHALAYDSVEPVIDVIRRTEEAEVAVVFKEDDNGAWQASARSRGNVDVGRVCMELGGGGHRAAAGFTCAWPVPEAVERLRLLLADGGSAADGGR